MASRDICPPLEYFIAFSCMFGPSGRAAAPSRGEAVSGRRRHSGRGGGDRQWRLVDATAEGNQDLREVLECGHVHRHCSIAWLCADTRLPEVTRPAHATVIRSIKLKSKQ